MQPRIQQPFGQHFIQMHIAAIKGVVFILCLLPLAWLILQALWHGLGANPIEVLTHTLGSWTLVFLLITLSVTPLRRLVNWPGLLRLRRMLGLYVFFYACLHFLTYIVLDQFFDWEGIVKDVIKRPFITVGFSSFILLIPLALTSTDAMVRRLGAQRWLRLHRLVYVIAMGGVVHYWWLVKKDITEPLLYGCVLLILLGYRLGVKLRARRAQSAYKPASL